MSQPVDRRRRQWVPLSVWFAVSKTGTALQEEFGRDGLLVWALYLAACKRNWVQGQFTYSTEADGWERLGLLGEPPDFTLERFFDVTGRLKQTSRRGNKSPRTLKDVVCTHWAEWNDEIRRERQAERMARKRATNTGDIERLPGDDTAASRETEVEVEVESYYEVEAKRATPAPAGSGAGSRPKPGAPARTAAALSFVRNGAAAEIPSEAVAGYLAREYNLAPLEVAEVLEAADRAQASAELDERLARALPTMAEELEDAIADDDEDIPF